MYKVMLVDDESWVVESLKDFVDWGHYGFEVIGQAYNGFDALDMIRDRQPDVVFTDIRMPGMSGLELIQRGKTLSLPVHFVVISGYAEFAYAQKAMSHGAVAYCLKPYDDTEIIAVLLKLKKMLDKETRSNDLQLLDLLEEPDQGFQSRLLAALQQRGISDWSTGGIVAIVAVGSGELAGTQESVKLKLGKTKTAYIMRGSQAELNQSKWLNEIPPHISGIGICGSISDLNDVRQAIEQADMAAYQSFISPGSKVCLYRTYDQDGLNLILIDMSEAIREKNILGVNETFEKLIMLFQEGALSIQHAFQVYNMIISFLFNLGKTESMLYSFDQLTQHFKHVHEMLERLNRLTSEHLRNANTPPIESKHQTLNAILDYVRCHFRQDISLQDLSEQFHMNPSYISHLFKKEVGETFTAYLSGRRIAYSCELLVNGDSPINEIAEQAGYNDYFYFTRSFKKATGLTPTQYRTRHQEA